ncbi:MAG: signal peptidase I [Bacilli bacterium]|nr:signal peptidase I [Bacilli bacterium]
MEEKKKEEETNENKWKKFIKEYGPYFILFILILIFKKYCYSPLYVHGESMMNTLHEGDIMILDIIGYKTSDLERFDIVVIDSGQDLIIKRVIGLPGEKISYRDNTLYVNDQKVEDPYGSNPTEDFEVNVPKGQYFVLGDNRGNSMDSRYFGPFSKDEILGKTKLVILPFSRFGEKE